MTLLRHEAFVLHFMRAGAALIAVVVVGWLAALWRRELRR